MYQFFFAIKSPMSHMVPNAHSAGSQHIFNICINRYINACPQRTKIYLESMVLNAKIIMNKRAKVKKIMGKI